LVETTVLSRQEAEDFVYRESRLLDEWRLQEWNALFTADGIYRMPVRDDSDPDVDPMIVDDDADQRAIRIHQLLRYEHYAQSPRSRTTHHVTNVEVEDTSSPSRAIVHCTTIVFEIRPVDFAGLQAGLGRQRAIAMRCRYDLRHEDGAWKMAEKRLLLLDRDVPLYNLTFLM
jgi:3-phenylpropionate/cinnamic acid dioxygenase small subunit